MLRAPADAEVHAIQLRAGFQFAHVSSVRNSISMKSIILEREKRATSPSGRARAIIRDATPCERVAIPGGAPALKIVLGRVELAAGTFSQ